MGGRSAGATEGRPANSVRVQGSTKKRGAAQKRAAEGGDTAREKAKRHILEMIRGHVASRDGEEVEQAMGRLTMENILSTENIREAIKEIKKGTVPGDDGFDTGFFSNPEVEEMMTGHLKQLYTEIRLDKIMPAAMRTAKTSMLYKGRGGSQRMSRRVTGPLRSRSRHTG